MYNRQRNAGEIDGSIEHINMGKNIDFFEKKGQGRLILSVFVL